MTTTHSTKYSQFFAIFSNLQKVGYPNDREELIYEFTNGRTESLRDLTPHEYRELLQSMQSMYNQTNKEARSKEDRQRRKIIALFCQMGYKKGEKADMTRINAWCETYGHLKSNISMYRGNDLVKLVNQADKVYKSFLESL